MFINIRELAATGNTVYLSEQFGLQEFVEQQAEIVSAASLQADLQARHQSGAVYVTGTLRTEMTFVCSRCLGHYTEKMDIPFAEVFAYKPEKTAEDDEADIHYVTEAKIDLWPFIAENIALEIPFVPLCSESCKGLCSVCGTNRNERECGCKEERIDPRLAGLQDYFNRER